MAPLKKTFVGVLLMVLASSTLFVVVAQKKVASNERVDCSPDDPFISSDVCAKRDCIFDTENNEHVPKCYFPINTGYWANGTRESNTANGLMITTTLVKASGAGSPFGEDITSIYFETSNIGSTLSIRIGHEGRRSCICGEKSELWPWEEGEVEDTIVESPICSSRKSWGIVVLEITETLQHKTLQVYEPQISLPRSVFHSTDNFVVEQSNRTGGLIFADQYIQIAAFLGTSKIYGFGENSHTQLQHDMEHYTTWGMFARDQPYSSSYPIHTLPYNYPNNLYGAYPFYIALESDYNAHGVFILNSNPQEVTLGPAPHLVYRTIGGILDIFFFPGPRPEDVIRQYLAIVGTPFLPPYWAFGYQLGSDGYRNVSEIRSVISDMQNRRLYLDAISAGYEYMEKYQDFTVANNASFIEWERQDQVPKDIQDLYPLAKNTKIMLGVLRPDRHVAYADFSANETIMWWKDKITNFHRNFSFDGMMLSNNEPTSFDTNEAWPSYFNESDHANIVSLKCPINTNDPTNSKYDLPPYATVNVFAYTNQQQKGYLSSKTLCMLAQTKAGRLYDTKNLYGLQQSAATQIAFSQALPKRNLLMTRSSFPSVGRYAGHWLGENRAQWDDMALSVIQIQEMNMFGIPFVGANICGYHGNTTQELCFRWTQLGAFYTFSRNQNDKWSIPQEPTRWHSVANAASEVNGIRYRFLPYLYTLHYLASRYGGTVIRPVFFEFPNDEVTHRLSFQFMWGSAVLIIPVLEANKTSVYGYLPNDENWYSLRSMEYGTERPSGFQFIEAPDFMPMPIYARGGHIIPKQTPAVTTAASRKNPFELLIALRFDSTQSTDGTTLPLPSYGELYWDDGETKVENFGTHEFYHWQFSFETTEGEAILNISTMATAKFNLPTLDRIEIFGYPFVPLPTTMKFNGVLYGFNYRFSYYSEKTKTLTLRKTNFITMPTSGSLRITWAHRSAAFLKKIPSTQRITCLPDAAPVSECPFRGCIHDENRSNKTGIFSFKVRRTSTKSVIWDTSIGGLLFGDQYIQIAAFLGSSEIYGLGENAHQRLRHELEDYRTWGMFTRNQNPPSFTGQAYDPQNLYGVHPFYIAFEDDYNAHGVFFLNSNAQEITLGPAPQLIYRTIGGILDIYFFPGPTPADVVQQYLALIGTPLLPPYWALGFQLGREGFNNVQSIQNLVSATQTNGIPLDAIFVSNAFADNYQDFTVSKEWSNFSTFVEDLHRQQLHVIITLDPAITANSEALKRALTQIMLGVLEPNDHVAYADFFASKTGDWWKSEIATFFGQLGFDGIVLTNNEPTSFGTNSDNPDYSDVPNHTNLTSLHCPVSGSFSKYDNPPYATINTNQYFSSDGGSYLSSKTLCMDGITQAGILYNTKDVYGMEQSKLTQEALKATTAKRSMVITRSSFPSSGRYAGHWLGDNAATWEDMRLSVVAVQEFNMFGMPYVGADICGFRGNSLRELCTRWQQLGAFYTLSRNNNDKSSRSQFPTNWQMVAAATVAANNFRYYYLPYLYTLHFKASMNGATVIRPTFFEFSYDDATHEHNWEFMWGNAILIVPVLEPYAEYVYAYLPYAARWFSIRESDYGKEAPKAFSFMQSPYSELIPVFIRGGTIVPRQKPEQTTTASRRNPFELLIAIDGSTASGQLIWDDGESIVEDFNKHNYFEFLFNFDDGETSTLHISKKKSAVSTMIISS
ncbi:unnamed protein product [Toxocara canis]|uniref:P-type domain-containing protein n=1 Tax=Toxocara canis TaxID=6265 RepID=A0A183UFK2_TOXCA|nr:unnamed protein product [Toxocara canis]